MDSVYAKRTLRVPILRTLGRWVVGAKERGQLLLRRRRNKWSRGGGGRGGGGRGASRRDRPARRRSSNNRRKEPVVTSCSYSCQASYSYQAGKERTSGEEDMNTRRNAERATMRGHFRSKYRLGKNRKDAKHLRSAGGKVSLPTELSKLVRPKSKSQSQSNKDEGSFSLLGAFQNLSFGPAGPAKKTPRSPTSHVPVGPCKVM